MDCWSLGRGDRSVTFIEQYQKHQPMPQQETVRGVTKTLLRRRAGVEESFSSHQRSRKSFTLTIHWNLENPVKTCHGFTVRQHHTDQKRMGLLRECVEQRNVCWNQAWTKSGGLILWNATVIFEMSETSRQMGEHFMNGDLESQLKARSYRLTQRLNIIQSLRRTSQGSTNLVKKVSPAIVLGYALFAGRIWKPDFLVADTDCKMLDASEIQCSKTQRKGNDSEKRWQFHVPSRRWCSKLVSKRLWRPKIHSSARPTCKAWRSQKRPSRKFGKVSTNGRNKRRESPQRLLVDLSSSRRTSCSALRAGRRNFPNSSGIFLTWPGQRTQIWTCSRKAVLTSCWRQTAKPQDPTKMQKTKHACMMESHEPTRKRLEFTPSRNHEDHIARKKRFNSISHYI